MVSYCPFKSEHIEIETQYGVGDDDDDDDDDDGSLITVGCCGLLQSSTLSTHL